MKIYIPSYLGDVSLESDGNESKIVYTELTPVEKERLTKFIDSYKLPITEGKSETVVHIPENIQKAHKRFVKIFKIGKPTINAIKLKNGKIELVQEFPETTGKGVTTTKPSRGCPMPIWERAEQRATAVLKEFLSLSQWLDFEKYKSFICRGNYTGTPYLLTSRWNPLCQERGILYSLVDKRMICASMGDLPPAEELLGLKIAIECAESRFIGATLNSGWVYDW